MHPRDLHLGDLTGQNKVTKAEREERKKENRATVQDVAEETEGN